MSDYETKVAACRVAIESTGAGIREFRSASSPAIGPETEDFEPYSEADAAFMDSVAEHIGRSIAEDADAMDRDPEADLAEFIGKVRAAFDAELASCPRTAVPA